MGKLFRLRRVGDDEAVGLGFVFTILFDGAHGQVRIPELPLFEEVEDFGVGKFAGVSDFLGVGILDKLLGGRGIDEDNVGVVAVGAMADVAKVIQLNFEARFFPALTEGGLLEGFSGLEPAAGQVPLAFVAFDPLFRAVGLFFLDLGLFDQEIKRLERCICASGLVKVFVDDKDASLKERPAELLDGFDGLRSQILGETLGGGGGLGGFRGGTYGCGVRGFGTRHIIVLLSRISSGSGRATSFCLLLLL